MQEPIRIVKVVPINKFQGTVNRHKYWLVKDVKTTQIIAQKDSATEAIKFIEDEGLILQPD
jgi:hypothetical protein